MRGARTAPPDAQGFFRFAGRYWGSSIAVTVRVLPHLMIIVAARNSTAVVPLMCVVAAGILFLRALRRSKSRDLLRAQKLERI
jgi:hypothetical protein